MNRYRGITYFAFMNNRFFQWMFKKYFCPRNIHLFDECESLEWHLLSCDACGLEVHIKKIVEEKDINIDDMSVRNDNKDTFGVEYGPDEEWDDKKVP